MFDNSKSQFQQYFIDMKSIIKLEYSQNIDNVIEGGHWTFSENVIKELYLKNLKGYFSDVETLSMVATINIMDIELLVSMSELKLCKFKILDIWTLKKNITGRIENKIMNLFSGLDIDRTIKVLGLNDTSTITSLQGKLNDAAISLIISKVESMLLYHKHIRISSFSSTGLMKNIINYFRKDETIYLKIDNSYNFWLENLNIIKVNKKNFYYKIQTFFGL